MDVLLGVLLAICAICIVGWSALAYNVLVRNRNRCDESWADIDVELKRRYDLIPNLVNTVQAYAKHEREVFDRVSRARTAAMANHGLPQSQAGDENELVRGLRQLIALAENYPDLKANQNFLAIQAELANTEDRIQRARRFYNANVRDYQNRLQSVPSNLVAGTFAFPSRQFFEIEDVSQREAPAVKLG